MYIVPFLYFCPFQLPSLRLPLFASDLGWSNSRILLFHGLSFLADIEVRSLLGFRGLSVVVASKK